MRGYSTAGVESVRSRLPRSLLIYLLCFILSIEVCQGEPSKHQAAARQYDYTVLWVHIEVIQQCVGRDRTHTCAASASLPSSGFKTSVASCTAAWYSPDSMRPLIDLRAFLVVIPCGVYVSAFSE